MHAEVLEEFILHPLQMNATSFTPPDSDRVAEVHDPPWASNAERSKWIGLHNPSEASGRPPGTSSGSVGVDHIRDRVADTQGSCVATSVTYTATLPFSEDSVLFVSGLLHAERLRRGARRGARAVGCFKQAMLVLRWFLDGDRVAQLAADNDIGHSTAYSRDRHHRARIPPDHAGLE